MYDLPGFVWAAWFVGGIGMLAAMSVALYRGAIRAGLGRRAAAGVGAAAAALLGGWLVASSLLAGSGAYNRPGTVPLTLVAGGGALIAMLGATRIPVVSRVLAAPGTVARLAVLQTFRVVGLVWLVLMAMGDLPVLFALPAGIGDTATGIAALFVAWRLARGNGRRDAIWFNALGLADLVMAASLAAVARVLHVTPSTDALRLLPLALAPTLFVPLAMALHVVSLGRLLPRRAREAALQA
jgi:hypothetical protein